MVKDLRGCLGELRDLRRHRGGRRMIYIEESGYSNSQFTETEGDYQHKNEIDDQFYARLLGWGL